MLEWFSNSPLGTSGPADWLDIALLTWVIYRGLLFIRGTRAIQSLLGFGFLGLVWALSALVGLTTVRWVLDNLFVWFVLAVIILFQDDIRRALARAGGTLFGRTAQTSDANVIEEIIRACFAMAQRKIGALIALERSADLQPYCEGSHMLDAEVSTELLQCLFHPTSPIHDGAVVVRRRRLVAAGVFLPISLSKQISRAYGTRHRAAIGLTEATDAICLLVSEERGTVAIVQQGEVIPVADSNDLRQKLQESLEKRVPRVTAPGAARA